MDKKHQEIIIAEYANSSDVEYRNLLVSLSSDIKKGTFNFRDIPWKKYSLLILAVAFLPKPFVIAALLISLILSEVIPKPLSEYLLKLKPSVKNNLQPPDILQIENAFQSLLDSPSQISHSQQEQSVAVIRKQNFIRKILHHIENIDTTKGMENYIANLASTDLEKRLVARHALFRYGVDALPQLLEKRDTLNLESLIQSILKENHQKYDDNFENFLCPQCMQIFTRHKIDISSGIDDYFYACPSCKKAADPIDSNREFVALLDKDMEGKYIIEEQIVYINWLKEKQNFDFSWVEIINADDASILEFCHQLPKEQAKNMDCIAKCPISKSTKQVIHNTFSVNLESEDAPSNLPVKIDHFIPTASDENIDYQSVILDEYFYTDDGEFAQKLKEAVGNIPLETKKIGLVRFIWYALLFLLSLATLRTAAFISIVIWVSIFFAEWKNRNDKPESLAQAMPIRRKIDHAASPDRENPAQLERALHILYEQQKLRGGIITETLQKLIDIYNNIDTSLPVKKYILNLRSSNWEKRMEARHALFRYGTEAVEELHQMKWDTNYIHGTTKEWLLEAITRESVNRYEYKGEDYVCPTCFTRFNMHFLDNPKHRTLYYYGCKTCGQDRNFFHCPEHIIAILDEDAALLKKEEGNLIVNWLKLTKIFDFDNVKIIKATDRDVERFAIQVGNDTDDSRVEIYKSLVCFVECPLEQNTLRILENTFGEVRRI